MKIKNTDGSYCKIKDIKVTGLKAYVTLIVYSSIPQVSEDILGNVHRVFSFYLRDKNSTELYKISHNNYWIDRNNNYNTDTTNIDINMYKEIILEVDITNNNQSDMLDNKWIRKCNIVMIDHTINSEEAWVSEDLELISKEIELPKFTGLKISTGTDNILSVEFKLLYESQEDFNYINKNLITEVSILSTLSNETIESLDFENSTENFISEQKVCFSSLNEYTQPVVVQIKMKNLRGDILSIHKEFFNPVINNLNLSIKDTDTLRVKSAHIKDTDIKNINKIYLK